MYVLQLTYSIVVISGCFRPQSWTSPLKRAAYSGYRLYIIAMIYAFTLSQFLDIVLVIDNPEDFTNNLNMMLTTLGASYKISIMWMNYEKVATLMSYIVEEPFRPLNPGEIEIQQKFYKIIRKNTLGYTLLIESTCTFIAIVSLFTSFRQRTLMYREWVPYDYSSYVLFCFTYFQQAVSVYHLSIINVAIDTLICALLMYICYQIEVLEYRLGKISKDPSILAYCIRHHNRIFEFARLVSTRFSPIIGFQFITSTMVICTNLYQLTMSTLSSNHVALIMYTCCMLTEIFIYCWFGNKVKLKSLQLANNIFQLDWSQWSNNIKKSLLIVMIRSEIPIEFSIASIVTMNLESFIALLKLSYSAYNLLVRVKER